MIRVLIIEDEPAAALNLQAILQKVAPDMEVQAVLESVSESVEWFGNHPMPQLIFMDIHLADGDSFRIFDRTEITAPVIFTTAYDQYALEAFRANGIGYLLKPIATVDMERVLRKWHMLARQEVSDPAAAAAAAAEQTERVKAAARSVVDQQVFLIHVRDKIIPLERDTIAFIYTRDEQVSACDMRGESYRMDKPLELLQGMLPAADFFRVNRQYIVARRAVGEISVWFGGRLKLQLKVAVPEPIVIPKGRVGDFKQWLMSVHPPK